MDRIEEIESAIEGLAPDERSRIAKWICELAPQPGTPDFFSAKGIEELISEQGIHTIDDIGTLAGAIPDEDVDEFVAEIYRDRVA